MKKSQLRAVQIGGVGLVLLVAGYLYYLFRPHADTQSPAVKAFPTAEGFGADSIGGRGGQVIEVTNLLDLIPDETSKLIAAPGSLRAAIETKGPRIVVFRVSGNIDLGRSVLEIKQPFLTIAGQTAPGDGITLKNGWVPIKSHDIVLRHFRIRPGPGGYESIRPNGASANVIDIGSPAAHNIVFDHMSISWGTDENFTVRTGAKNVTVQNSIISEAMHCVPPPFSHSDTEKCHSKNILMYNGATDVTFYRSLFAHAIDRNPLIMSGNLEFINNVTYNYGGPMYIIPMDSPINANIIGNAFRAGYNSLRDRPEKHEVRLHGNCSGNGPPCFGQESSVYHTDNLGTDTSTEPFRPARVVCADGPNFCIPTPETPHSLTNLAAASAETAYVQVLNTAGATLPKRDAVDERIVNDVKNGTGKVINEPGEVGGWPELNSTAAPIDTDKDGMPDQWETKHGLDPNRLADANHDGTNDGYTNIEKYLNELAQDISYGNQQFETFGDPTLDHSPPGTDLSPLPSIGPLTSPSPAENPSPESNPEPSSEPSPEPSVVSFDTDLLPDPSPNPENPENSTGRGATESPASVASNKPATTKSAPKPKIYTLPKLLEPHSATTPSPIPSGSLRPLILVGLSDDADQKTSSNQQGDEGKTSFVDFFQNLFAGIFGWFSNR